MFLSWRFTTSSCTSIMPLPTGIISFCIARNVGSCATGGMTKYDTARCVSVVPYMLMMRTFAASACRLRQSRFVKTLPAKKAFCRWGIWRVACAHRSWPMAWVRCVTVTWLSAIHSARRPGMPMSSAVGTCSWAPKKRGVNTSGR